jgi:hypothetical protein
MATFTKPNNLNGAELRDELRAAGIEISDLSDAVQLNEKKELVLDIAEADATKAKTIVDAHNGTIVAPELTIGDKLASVGLSVDDLKAALGI